MISILRIGVAYFSTKCPIGFWFFFNAIKDIYNQIRKFKDFFIRNSISESDGSLRDAGTLISTVGSEKSALFAVHSFSFSGAENYALSTARIAKDIGYKIIWVVDYDTGDHSEAFLTLSDLVCYVSTSDNTLFTIRDLCVENNLEIKLIHIHHSVFAYNNLKSLRSLLSPVKVLDSTHIIERNDRGFPSISASCGNLIDSRNVISQGLVDYFLRKGVTNLLRTVITPEMHSLAKVDDNIFTIKIIGRLCYQKRSYLIPMLLDTLERRLDDFSPDHEIRFEVIGSGIFYPILEGLGPFKNFEFVLKSTSLDKGEIYHDADLVIQLSENEGITVVSYECAVSGVPIISTNVGQQSESIHPDMLVPKSPISCISNTIDIVFHILSSKSTVSDVCVWQIANFNHLKSEFDYRNILRAEYLEIYKYE